MDVLLWIAAADYEKVRRILLRDETVSRASLTFREARIAAKEGYYCWVAGSDEACAEARRIARLINSFAERGVVREVRGKEKEDVIGQMEEETGRAIEGLGGLFG